jgi:hypothetical protein
MFAKSNDLKHVQLTINSFRIDIDTLRNEFALLESLIHNDGTYLWRIDNIKNYLINQKMLFTFAPYAKVHVIAQKNVKQWIGKSININFYVKTRLFK